MPLATCTDLISSTGARLFIAAGATSIPATFDADGYDDLTWTEIGALESIGEFGPENEIGSFRPLNADTVCQYMAGKQPQTINLTMARATGDDGQVALLAHQGVKTARAYKIETSEVGTTTGGHTTPAKYHRYLFMGLCASAKITVGSGADVVKLSANLAITGPIVEAQKANSAA